MYCPFCGSEISDDSTFCPMCGQSINSPDVNVRKEEKESKKATGTMHWVLVLITVVLLLVTMIGIGTALYLHFRDSSEKISQEIKKDDLKKEVKKEKAEEETKDEEDKSDKSAKDEAKAPADEEEDEEEKYDPTEGGIHRYEFIIADVTWSQAFADCKSRGGYLVRINSEEEYQYILKQLDAGSYQKIQFFIGGRRDSGSSEYYWADEDDELYGDQINTSSYWCSSEWLSGEPSFRDGANEEEYLDLLYYKNEGRWTWNDAPNDILAVVPSFSGRIGYICEYED